MGGNSTGQAMANQATNQQAAEQYYQSMVNNMFNKIGSLPAAPVNKWGPITGPGKNMSTAWDPSLSPLAQSLSGYIPGMGGSGGSGGGRGGGGARSSTGTAQRSGGPIGPTG